MIQQNKCPYCGAPVLDGGYCSYCGNSIPKSNTSVLASVGNFSIRDDLRNKGYKPVDRHIVSSTANVGLFVCRADNSNKLGLLNTDGNIVIECLYDELMLYFDFGLCLAKINSLQYLFNINGELIMESNDKFIIEKPISNNILIVGAYINGAFKYGLYSLVQTDFLFPIEFLTIECQQNGQYMLRKKIGEEDSTDHYVNKIISVDGDNIIIENETEQSFHNSSRSNGGGCFSVILILIMLFSLSFI